MFASPTEARAPNAVPLPRSALGIARSPLIVTPVPPFGLLQFGIPSAWAASGDTAHSAVAMIVRMRFIDGLRMLSSLLPTVRPSDRPTVRASERPSVRRALG